LIIKLYRKQLYNTKFKKLEDYVLDFIKYLQTNTKLITEEQEEHYFQTITFTQMSLIKDDIDKNIQQTISNKNSIEEKEVETIIDKVIDGIYTKWNSKEDNNLLKIGKNILDKYKTHIDDIRKNVFEQLPISDSLFEKIKEIIYFAIIKKDILSSYSGIVIAGYGEEDLFPSVYSILL
jgi:hypothetical protein